MLFMGTTGDFRFYYTCGGIWSTQCNINMNAHTHTHTQDNNA